MHGQNHTKNCFTIV